jgi:glycosyltransferase involved in cell wall biosynthesis/GT2 family glycosyltransferase
VVEDLGATRPSPLRVLYSFPGTFGTPGIGWTAWNQVNELVRSGHEVHLVTAKLVKAVPGIASTTYSLTVGGLRIPHRMLGHLRSFAWHDRVAARTAQLVHPDVVHVWPGSGLATMAAARQMGVPTVRECPNTHTANAYDLVERESAALGLAIPASASHSRNNERLAVEEREWAAATGLLVPSEVVARSFWERGFDEDRLLRHQYGCTIDRSVERGDGDRPFTAVFLGRGEPRKGLHYALQAWRQSSVREHGRFLIYGRIDPGYQARLAGLLAGPGVEVRGFTGDPVHTLLQSDALLLPSIEEGSALVSYEAQVTGCVPLVSMAAGAVLEHDVHGLVHDVGDVDTLARQLDDLAAHPERLARLRANAMAHAQALSWSAASERLVAAYRTSIEFANEPRRPLSPANISVVVCTRNRPAMLADALGSIRSACHPEMEVIVVDSASTTTETREVALANRCIYVRSDVPGLSIARNIGLRHSIREVVVFTDDDCQAEPGWHEVLRRHFEHPRVGAVTGQMRHHDVPVPIGSERTFRRPIEGLDAGHGAIMAFRRELTLGLGGFDEVLGAGRRLAGAEDLDMFCRVLEAGAIIVHDPACAVVHMNTREGDDFPALLRNYGLGLGALGSKWLRQHPRTGLRLNAIVVARAVRQWFRGQRDRRARRGAQALMTGYLSGFARAQRLPLSGSTFIDTEPPTPVVLRLTSGGTAP